jgi:glycosyltransferase involved in cell wall biosynthesis
MLKLSVIICTYNRAKWIIKALESSLNQSLSKEKYEVIVINNNCTDNTQVLVDNFITNNSDLNIKQLIEVKQGLSFARNRGMLEAKASLILYMDDDGVADYYLFERIVSYMNNNPEVVGLGGKVTPIYESHPPKWLNPYLIMMVTAIDYGDKEIKCKGKKYPPGCNMTYRKEILEKVGGFNEELKWRVDDKYIFLKVSEISDKIMYSPELNVGHHIDEERLTDENFNNLSLKLGHDERRRVLSISFMKFLIKIVEYKIKFFGSILIGFGYLFRNNWYAGRYIIRFRYLSLLGLLNLKMYTK